MNSNESSERISKLKEKSNILPKGNTKASNLSGGERNLLALEMVLLTKPEFIILDEPSAGLSHKNTKHMYEILTEIKKSGNIGMLIIEQRPKEAIDICDRVVVLENGHVAREIASKLLHTDEKIDNLYFG